MSRMSSPGIALSLVALLLFGCDSSNPADPSPLADLDVVTARAVSELGAPSGVTVVVASGSSIEVSWQDNSTSETGFEVHRSVTGAAGVVSLLQRTTAGVTRAVDNEVQGTDQHCYKIRAVRVLGKKSSYSAFSNLACSALPPAPLTAPSNLTAVAAVNTYIEIKWQDNSSSETSFLLSRASSPSGDFYLLATTVANTVVHSDLPYYPGQLYCYQVRAVRKTTYPDGSASYTYSEISNTACVIAPPPLPPAAASATDATPSSSTTMTVSWSVNSSNEEGFRVYRSTDGGNVWVLAGTAARSSFGQSSGFEDTGLQSERAVCYKVVAFNSGGEATASTAACATPPSYPTSFTATRLDAQTILFSWSDNSALEDGYQVWVTWGYGVCDGFSAGWYEGESLIAELPAGSTSFRYTETVIGCGFPDQGANGYFVVATRDGGRSTAASAGIP